MSDIAAISSLQQSQVRSEVSYAVARKTLDHAKAQGDAAISLLESAANLQQTAQTKRPLAPGQTFRVTG